jgi:hypothetical protein
MQVHFEKWISPLVSREISDADAKNKRIKFIELDSEEFSALIEENFAGQYVTVSYDIERDNYFRKVRYLGAEIRDYM